MDPRLEPLFATVELNDHLFSNCFDGVDAASAQRRFSPHTNNMSFVGAHLVEVRFFLISRLGDPVKGPFAELLDGIRGIDELRRFPAPERILEGWKRGGELLRQRLETLDAADLDDPFPERIPASDRTVLGSITFLLHHEAYHIGQLAMLRKAAGFAAMAY